MHCNTFICTAYIDLPAQVIACIVEDKCIQRNEEQDCQDIIMTFCALSQLISMFDCLPPLFDTSVLFA